MIDLDPLATRDVVVMTATFVLAVGIYYVWWTTRSMRQGRQIRELRDRMSHLEGLNQLLLKQVTELQVEVKAVREENYRLRAALSDFYGPGDLDAKIRKAFGGNAG